MIQDAYQRDKGKQIKAENMLFDQGFAPLHSSPSFASFFSAMMDFLAFILVRSILQVNAQAPRLCLRV